MGRIQEEIYVMFKQLLVLAVVAGSSWSFCATAGTESGTSTWATTDIIVRVIEDIEPGVTHSGMPALPTGDDVVNIDDVFAVLGLWGFYPDSCSPYCPGDLTEDCQVNIDDIF